MVGADIVAIGLVITIKNFDPDFFLGRKIIILYHDYIQRIIFWINRIVSALASIE